jgi:heme/copper-type cytochrome/quinol oxidase subunit 3
MSIKNFSKKHYYNNLSFTLWPFLLCSSLFVIVYMTVFLFNKYYLFSATHSFLLLTIFLAIFLDSVMGWIAEVREEAFCGKYTKKLKSAIVFGSMLFLVSEVMLFGSFFWVYFDRLFHLSYVTGYLSVPTSVELIRWFKEPLYATLVLITSGYTCNYSFYLYRKNDLLQAYFYSVLTNLLGFIFLYIQYMEYTHLKFTISDTVYCAVFFLLTGFHGLHVLIGNIFLLIQYWFKWKENNKGLLGLTLALIYWHFVDIIWIFLFIFVYLFNNLDYLSIKSDADVLIIDMDYYNRKW